MSKATKETKVLAVLDEEKTTGNTEAQLVIDTAGYSDAAKSILDAINNNLERSRQAVQQLNQQSDRMIQQAKDGVRVHILNQ